MAVDEGSREIRALLETPDDDLEANLRTLGEALPEDDAEAATPDWTTFEALRKLRRFYQRLSRSVRAIRTSSPAKGDVLAALRSLDAGLKLFARGLKGGNSDTGRARVADGAEQTQTAATELAQATKALT